MLTAYIKIAAGVVLFLILTAILELIFNQYEPGTAILSYYRASSAHRNAGGLTGGCIVSLLCPLIGEIGTYVVLFILAIICMILITEKITSRADRKAEPEGIRRSKEKASGDCGHPGASGGRTASRSGGAEGRRSFKNAKDRPEGFRSLFCHDSGT